MLQTERHHEVRPASLRTQKAGLHASTRFRRAADVALTRRPPSPTAYQLTPRNLVMQPLRRKEGASSWEGPVLTSAQHRVIMGVAPRA